MSDVIAENSDIQVFKTTAGEIIVTRAVARPNGNWYISGARALAPTPRGIALVPVAPWDSDNNRPVSGVLQAESIQIIFNQHSCANLISDYIKATSPIDLSAASTLVS
jgi:hypothetical protein